MKKLLIVMVLAIGFATVSFSNESDVSNEASTTCTNPSNPNNRVYKISNRNGSYSYYEQDGDWTSLIDCDIYESKCSEWQQ